MNCTCGGIGIMLSGHILDRSLTISLCECARDSVAAQTELRSLRRRWGALVSPHAVDEAFDAIMSEPGAESWLYGLSRENVERGLRAALEAALHLDELDSTSYLDLAAQKRIAELEQQLADMQIGRGRLAAILHQGHHGRSRDDRCCNPECKGQWGTGCYCCHHPRFALSSHDHDALGAYTEKERSRG